MANRTGNSNQLTSQEILAESNPAISAALLDAVAVPVMVIDHQGHIYRCNGLCEKLTGYALADIQGKFVWELLSATDARAFRAIFQQLPQAQLPQQVSHTWVTKAGEKRLTAWSFNRLDSQDPTSYWVATGERLDNNRERQAEQPLLESERLIALIESSSDFIALADMDGRMTFVNQAGRQLVGLPNLAAVKATTIADYFGDKALKQLQDEVLPTVVYEGSWQGELELRHFKTGVVIPVLFNSTLVRDPKTGDPICLGTVGREVGEIRQLEQDRRKTETALHSLMVGTAAVTGEDFFPILAEQVAIALGVKHALVTQRVDDHLQTLAFWSNGELQPNFSYAYLNTPCELSLQQGIYACPVHVQQQFPEDHELPLLEAESYLGVVMKNRLGEAIGNLSLVDVKPLQDVEQMATILRIFAARAAAEFERQQATYALESLNQDLEHRIQQRTSELLTSEQKFRAIFDNTFQFIGLMTPEGVVVEVNQALLKFAGVSLDQMRNQLLWETCWWELLSSKTRRQIKRAVRKAAKGDFVRLEVELRGTNNDAITADFSIRPVKDAAGEVVLLIPEARDISELKRIEYALQESQTLLQLVMDNLPQAVFWKDRDCRYLGCNRQLLLDSGFSSVEEIIGKTDFEMPWYVEAPAYRADDQEVMALGQPKLNIEEPITKTGNAYRWLRTNKMPLRNIYGETIGILGTYEDITEQKTLESQLLQSNERLALLNLELSRATRLKDEFLANMSHELRTPLSSILGMTQALQREIYGPVTERQQKSLGIVERSGRHLLALINDILELAKIESGKLELHLSKVSVDDLISASFLFVQQQALQKHIHVDCHITPEIDIIEADELRLKQALINLLDNAVKFTPEGGEVKLEVSLVPNQNSPSFQDVSFAVTDNGIGIPPKDQPRLFQAFVQLDSSLTRQYAGTGLGLALVKRIVDLHGGSVEVESEPQVGSCFTLRLPYQAGQQPVTNSQANHDIPTQATIASQPQPAVHNGYRMPRVLVVEDNHANRQMLQDILEIIGYQVETAEDGEMAMQRAESQSPDLILMDIQMPKMDGFQVMQRLRTNPQFTDLPIIALTALVMPGDRERCLAAGATDYLPKPVQIDELKAMLDRWLT
jgi:PAS domain S-box-containing protein